MSFEKENALELRDLVHVYQDGTRALGGVSFSVGRGERVALVGPNGSGKTSLVMHLNGLLLPSSGSVWVNGRELAGSSTRHARASVGLLFQDPDDQLFMPTLLEDVAFGPLNLGLGKEEAYRRALAALASVGLSGREQRAPQVLSGGQKRLAALAGLLAMEPVLLALDEPTSGLDPRSRRGLVERLRDLPQALLVASHDLEFCLEVCHRAVVLDEGSVVREGPVAEVFGDALFMEAHGLEKPHSLDHRGGVRHEKGPHSAPAVQDPELRD